MYAFFLLSIFISCVISMCRSLFRGRDKSGVRLTILHFRHVCVQPNIADLILSWHSPRQLRSLTVASQSRDLASRLPRSWTWPRDQYTRTAVVNKCRGDSLRVPFRLNYDPLILIARKIFLSSTPSFISWLIKPVKYGNLYFRPRSQEYLHSHLILCYDKKINILVINL